MTENANRDEAKPDKMVVEVRKETLLVGKGREN